MAMFHIENKLIKYIFVVMYVLLNLGKMASETQYLVERGLRFDSHNRCCVCIHFVAMIVLNARTIMINKKECLMHHRLHFFFLFIHDRLRSNAILFCILTTLRAALSRTQYFLLLALSKYSVLY